MGELTYYSAGLDQEITVAEPPSALAEAVLEALQEFMQSLVPFFERWMQAARPLLEMLQRMEQQRRREAVVSRRWSDPRARWIMWNRKADRATKAWVRRCVTSAISSSPSAAA